MSSLIAGEYQFAEVGKLIEMPIKPHKIGFAEVRKTKTKSICCRATVRVCDH